MTNHVGVILEPSSIVSLRVFLNGDFECFFSRFDSWKLWSRSDTNETFVLPCFVHKMVLLMSPKLKLRERLTFLLAS